MPGECCRIGNVWIAYSGAGWNNASAASEQLIDRGVNQLISWGCAAGISNTLRPGDLVLASEVVSTTHHYAIDSLLLQELQQRLGSEISIFAGKLFSSKELIGNRKQKQQIHSDSQAIALDMESAAIAETAQRANIPCLVIRSIADPASQDLPQAVITALNDQGQVELTRLISHLLCHPWELGDLIRLGLNFRAAQKTLKKVCKIMGLLETKSLTAEIIG